MKKFIFIFLSIALIGYLTFTGSDCKKKDENPTSTPTTPPTGSLGTMTLTPDGIIVNNNDTVIIRVNVTAGLSVMDSIIVYKVDNSGNEIARVGRLLDNGNLANADEIASDNIFSGKIVFNESNPGTINLKGKATLNSSGNPTASTSSTVLTVYSQLTSQEFGQLNNIQTQAATQMQTYLGGNPNNIQNAMTQLVGWLQGQAGVQSVENQGTTSLLINYTSGLSGGLVFSILNSSGQVTTRGGFISDTLMRIDKRIPVGQQTVGVNEFGNLPKRNYYDNPIDPNIIGNRNVLIYAPFEAAFAPWNERTNIINRLNQSACKGFNITSLIDQQATVSSLFSLTNYGYIVLATHGSQGKEFATGEVVDTNAQVYKTTYKALLKAGRLSIWNNMTISNTGGVVIKARIYAVKASFISNLAGTFPNSVILNNSCESTMNPNLSNAFINKGAKTYYGFTKVVNSPFCVTIADSITKRLAVDNMTTGNAFFNATDPTAPNAVFEIKVGSNTLKFSPDLINGDFEYGTIDGWSKAGDGRVITRLGTVNPTQGSFMGIISTGLGYTTSSGSISQCVIVPNNVSNLKLKWNFLSEEFLEYIGSQYQDYFEIKLKKQDGTEVTLFRKTIDQIASMFGATQQNPGQLISVSPGIVFDQGGVYMTNWQTGTFDIIAYRGQTVTLIFAAGDVGDSIYDTAILLDEVKLE